MRSIMVLTVLLLSLASAPASARVNEDGGLCWDPDIEFPVPCDEDED